MPGQSLRRQRIQHGGPDSPAPSQAQERAYAAPPARHDTFCTLVGGDTYFATGRQRVSHPPVVFVAWARFMRLSCMIPGTCESRIATTMPITVITYDFG